MEHWKYRNTNPFTTPEGYFEQLNRNIIEATCNNAPAPKRATILNVAWRKYVSYVASAAIILFIAGGMLFNGTLSETAKKPAPHQMTEAFMQDNEIDSEFIDNMLTSYPIDEYTFYCYLTE